MKTLTTTTFDGNDYKDPACDYYSYHYVTVLIMRARLGLWIVELTQDWGSSSQCRGELERIRSTSIAVSGGTIEEAVQEAEKRGAEVGIEPWFLKSVLSDAADQAADMEEEDRLERLYF